MLPLYRDNSDYKLNHGEGELAYDTDIESICNRDYKEVKSLNFNNKKNSQSSWNLYLYSIIFIVIFIIASLLLFIILKLRSPKTEQPEKRAKLENCSSFQSFIGQHHELQDEC